MITLGASLVVALNDFPFTETLTSVITCISNTGPGLGFDLNLAFDDLRFLPLSPAMETGTVLVWKKDQALTPVIEAFHQHIKNVQSAYGGQETKH